MKTKTFEELKKGDSFWVFDNSYCSSKQLREIIIKKAEKEHPATLPAYSSKWIIHTDQEPFRLRIDVEGEWFYIMKEDFNKSVSVKDFDWDNIEFRIIGTSKEAILKKLRELKEGYKRGLDYSFNMILDEIEK